MRHNTIRHQQCSLRTQLTLSGDVTSLRRLFALQSGGSSHSHSAPCFRRVICYSSDVTCLLKRRFLPLFTSLLALQVVAVGCLPYAKRSFTGPATVTDTGMFSYYRYHFLFSPKLPLRQKRDQTYQFRGMPIDEMTLSFAVVPFEASQVDLLKSLTTVLSAEMRDENGRLVCLASGRLSESLRGTSPTLPPPVDLKDPTNAPTPPESTIYAGKRVFCPQRTVCRVV